MEEHLWQEDKNEIIKLGFHGQTDTRNQTALKLERKIREIISTKTNAPVSNIPPCKCRFIHPFLQHEKHRHTTKNCEVQCRQQDVATIAPLMIIAYDNDNRFAFYKTCHTNPYKYKKAIIDQEENLQQSRVVHVEGITKLLMESLEPKLMKLLGVCDACESWKTATSGTWNMMTTK